MQQTDYYAVLQVAPNASPEDLRTRYRELARQYHPDLQRVPEEKVWAEERMKELNEAMMVLGEPDLRRTYDAQQGYNRCAYHSQAAPVAVCGACGQPICKECVTTLPTSEGSRERTPGRSVECRPCRERALLLEARQRRRDLRLRRSRQRAAQTAPLSLSQALGQLSSTQPHLRREAVRALGLLTDARALPDLIRAMDDWDAMVRARAVEGLAHLGRVEALPRLRAALADPEASVRRQAAEALAALGDGEAIPLLLDRLGDPDPDARQHAEWALDELLDHPSAVEPLLTALQADAPVRRARAAGALGRVAAPVLRQADAEAALLLVLGHADDAVQQAAARALGELGAGELAQAAAGVRTGPPGWLEPWRTLRDPRAVSPLLQFLAHPDAEVQERAIKALVMFGEPASAPLLDRLQHGSAEVRRNAARALGWLRSGQALPALARALQDEHGAVRAEAAWALGMLGEDRALPTLIRTLADPMANVRQAVMEALSSFGEEALVERFQTVFLGWRNWHAAWESQPDERLLPPLLRLFWEGSAEVRSRAGQALARFGSAAAVPFIPVLGERQGERAQRAMEFLKALGAPAREPLLAALRDPLPAVRAKVCALLAELGGSAARSDLLEAVRDESLEVQVAAIRALGQLRDPQAVPVLCQVLEEGRPEVRESAAHALGSIGSRRARPALKRRAALWSREEEAVKRACREALRQIG